MIKSRTAAETTAGVVAGRGGGAARDPLTGSRLTPLIVPAAETGEGIADGADISVRVPKLYVIFTVTADRSPT